MIKALEHRADGKLEQATVWPKLHYPDRFLALPNAKTPPTVLKTASGISLIDMLYASC